MADARDSISDEKESFWEECRDFGQSLLHSAIENPINGIVQIIDHAANAHIPELDIIGAPKHDSLGAKIGSVVGTAVDVTLASIATGGLVDVLGGAGLVGGMATGAVTGAVFGGILQPTDNSSTHFLRDRLENAGIDAVAFGVMGGVAGKLNSIGLYPSAAARTLLDDFSYGGVNGMIGGAAGAEAKAIIKDGELLPSQDDLAAGIVIGGLFGAAYGCIGHAYNNIGNKNLPVEVKTDKAIITTKFDKSGEPVSFESYEPSIQNPDLKVAWTAQKMSNGSWSGSGDMFSTTTGKYAGNLILPKVSSIETATDGTVTINTADGYVRSYTPGGKYQVHSATAQVK